MEWLKNFDIGSLFSRAIDDETLTGAEIVVPLLSTDENPDVVLTYLGNEDKHGNVSGKLVEVPKDVIQEYEGQNMFEPGAFEDFRMKDEMLAAYNEGIDVMLAANRENSMPQGLSTDKWFNPTPDMFPDLFTESNIEDVVSESVQDINHGLMTEKAQADMSDSEHSSTIEFLQSRADWAGAVFERVDRAEDLPAYKDDLLKLVNADPSIDPEQKAALIQEILEGPLDGPGADPGADLQLQQLP